LRCKHQAFAPPWRSGQTASHLARRTLDGQALRSSSSSCQLERALCHQDQSRTASQQSLCMLSHAASHLRR
jgi:hypothetical protein